VKQTNLVLLSNIRQSENRYLTRSSDQDMQQYKHKILKKKKWKRKKKRSIEKLYDHILY